MLEILNFMVKEMIREDLNIEELMSLAEEVSKNQSLAQSLQNHSTWDRKQTFSAPTQTQYV